MADPTLDEVNAITHFALYPKVVQDNKRERLDKDKEEDFDSEDISDVSDDDSKNFDIDKELVGFDEA